MQKRKKIIVIHNYITPVRNYYFNYFNQYFGKQNIDFKVIYLSESDKNRHWKNLVISILIMKYWIILQSVLGKKIYLRFL